MSWGGAQFIAVWMIVNQVGQIVCGPLELERRPERVHGPIMRWKNYQTNHTLGPKSSISWIQINSYTHVTPHVALLICEGNAISSLDQFTGLFLSRSNQLSTRKKLGSMFFLFKLCYLPQLIVEFYEQWWAYKLTYVDKIMTTFIWNGDKSSISMGNFKFCQFP